MFIAVNIGRNIAGTPMSAARWAKFQRQTKAILRDAGKVVGHGTGQSVWGSVSEEFATFHVVTGYGLSMGARDRLATLATQYGQDAIGVMVESDLIYATEES